ncbi:MAG: DUF362 domain-containing protein, partial [Thermoflexus sp.]
TAVRALLETWAHDEGEKAEHQVILVKPNCVSARNPLASTHAEAVRAALEVLRQLRPHRLILAEGSSEDTLQAFQTFGYLPWAEKYGAEVLDLNSDASVIREVYDALGNPVPVRIAQTALTSFRVSLAVPKTHDCVIVTLGIKNLVVGAIQKPDKPKIHQGYPAINLNLALLARELAPHLSVIDGFVGMEGDGPVHGTAVPHRFALLGSDPVAVDAAAATLMGFNPRDIGYLVHARALGLGELEGWEVVGDPWAWAVRPYRPHATYAQQRQWGLSGTPLERKL